MVRKDPLQGLISLPRLRRAGLRALIALNLDIQLVNLLSLNNLFNWNI